MLRLVADVREVEVVFSCCQCRVAHPGENRHTPLLGKSNARSNDARSNASLFRNPHPRSIFPTNANDCAPAVLHAVIDGARVEAEIATLELLNQRDTMLCDDLRSACRSGGDALPDAGGAAGGGGAGGGRHHSKISCWALTQGIGFPKRAPGPAPLAVTTPALLGIRSGDGDGGSGSGSGDGPALLGNGDFGDGHDDVDKNVGNSNNGGDGGGKPAAPSEGERSAGSVGGGGSVDEDGSEDGDEGSVDSNKRPFSK